MKRLSRSSSIGAEAAAAFTAWRSNGALQHEPTVGEEEATDAPSCLRTEPPVHSFESVSSRMPTRCADCGKFIGIASKALRCTLGCRTVIHDKCWRKTTGRNSKKSSFIKDMPGETSPRVSATAGGFAPLEGHAADLFRAVEMGDEQTCLSLLESDPDLLSGRYGRDGMTAIIKSLQEFTLMKKVSREKCHIFRTMITIATRDQLNLRDGKTAWTPLMWAFACSFTSTELLDMLLETAGEKLDVTDVLAVFCSSFHRANYKRYMEWLVERGASISGDTPGLHSPLHRACQNHSIGGVLVRSLVKRGADVNRVNNRGETPIFVAVGRSREEIIHVLLDAGADVTIVDTRGKRCVEYTNSEEVMQILHDLMAKQKALREWLATISLADKYFHLFVRHSIYLDVAPQLTDALLTEVGVTVGGDRLRIMGLVTKTFPPTTDADAAAAKAEAEDAFDTSAAPSSPRLLKTELSRRGSRVGSVSAGARGGSRRASAADPARAQKKLLLDQIGAELSRAGSIRTLEQVMIEYRELQIFEELGRGTFGTVYRGARAGNPVAIKVLDDRGDEASNEKLRSDFVKQVKVWSQLSHESVIYLQGVCLSPQVVLVQELCRRGNLRTTMQDRKLGIDFEVALSWAAQLAEALRYLHSAPVLHRDLKPGNVLVDEDWMLKLADFDTARFSDDQATLASGRLVGSPAYIAPEMFHGETFDAKSDVYSLAIILNEIFIRALRGVHESPFEGMTLPPTQLGALIFAAAKGGRPQIPEEMPEAFRALVVGSWDADREARWSCVQIIQEVQRIARVHGGDIAIDGAWDQLRDCQYITEDVLCQKYV
jgi:hypothetical protein